MSRKVVGPFNRVEGDLEVQLDLADNKVQQARVNATLYRGFESLLVGKSPLDALVIVPRICGICSVSQSIAAAQALADFYQVSVPENGRRVTNLIHACENLADHLTHFYLFFMPDFARETYRGRDWFEPVYGRFNAKDGKARAAFLQARAELMHLMGVLAGKWPHSLAIQPGGVTRSLGTSDKAKLLRTLYAFRKFIESELFGDPLESVLAITTAADLTRWAGEARHQGADFATFLKIADQEKLDLLGQLEAPLMSFGNYPQSEECLFHSGVFDQQLAPLDTGAITEDVSSSWLQTAPPVHPAHGATQPDHQVADAYSWCKAPRLGGQVVEVGALARQRISESPLAQSLHQSGTSNVLNRVVARVLEAAQLVVAMEGWVRDIQPGQPFLNQLQPRQRGEGVGTIEAARGSLGHWLSVENGVIQRYQIIAPTTWNFSPRDQKGQAGALEQALVGTPVNEDEHDPVKVQHIVRSFDPCMVCTVH